MTTPALVPSPIPFDFHSHHQRCGHAEGDMSDYIERAIELGMTTFGVSDHGPAYWLPGDHDQPRTQMAKSEVEGYVAEALKLKARYADRIQVLVGIEADYIEGFEEELTAILNGYPFDYVLGSVHYAFGTNIFNPARWEHDVLMVFAEYYRLVAKAAMTGLFDIMSHLTAVESYVPPIPDDIAEVLYLPVADAIAASGAIVEINTSGYRKLRGDEPFPNRKMLRLLIDRGVRLTVSSDCHNPMEVGFGFNRVAAMLQELGVDTTMVQPAKGKARLTADSVGKLYFFPTGKRNGNGSSG